MRRVALPILVVETRSASIGLRRGRQAGRSRGGAVVSHCVGSRWETLWERSGMRFVDIVEM